MGTGNYSAEFYWCLPENKNERVQQIKLNCSKLASNARTIEIDLLYSHRHEMTK